jgi:hypothetical protein
LDRSGPKTVVKNLLTYVSSNELSAGSMLIPGEDIGNGFQGQCKYIKKLPHVLQLIHGVQPIRHAAQAACGKRSDIQLLFRGSAFGSPGVSTDSGALSCSVIIYVIRMAF